MINNNYLILAIIVVIFFIVYAIYKKTNIQKVDYAYNIILDKNRRYSNVPAKNNTQTVIPEQVIRGMVPSDILDKYYPDSLKNNMPHRRQIENFDISIVQDQTAVTNI